MRVRSGVWCALAAAWVVGGEAWAQTDTGALAATRRDLIQQAQLARASGDHARSLDLAQRAGQLGMSPSLRRFVAEEQNTLGQTGPALGNAELCLHEADRDAASPGRDEHLVACRALVTSLQGRVGRVVVELASPPPGARVLVAGSELPQVVWGVAHVVTPGAVVIEATAADHRPFRREVQVAAGDTVHVPVTLEALPHPVIAVAPVSAAVVPVATPAASTLRDTGEARGPGVAPFVVMGGGAGVMLLGGLFYAVRSSALSSSNAMCDATGCPETARADHDRAVTFNTLANVSLGVGAAAVVGGGLWYLLAPRGAAARRVSIDVRPAVSGGWMFGLRGAL